jgi:DNA-binding response OmpR family regulator
VVDDNQDAADSMVNWLALHDCEASAAYRGLMACELFDTFIPDVVLLDIALPDLSGYEVATCIRSSDSEALLLAITGLPTGHFEQRAHAAGFDGYLEKPADPAVVLEAIQAHMKVAAPVLPPRRNHDDGRVARSLHLRRR